MAKSTSGIPPLNASGGNSINIFDKFPNKLESPGEKARE